MDIHCQKASEVQLGILKELEKRSLPENCFSGREGISLRILVRKGLITSDEVGWALTENGRIALLKRQSI